MIGHVLLDITQEARCQDRNNSESDADIVNPLIGLGIRKLAGHDNHFIRCLIASNSGDLLDLSQQRSAGEFYDFRDSLDAGDVKLGHHNAANVVLCQRHKLGHEDIIVDGVADTATHDADGQSESGNGGNQVIGADDSGDNRSGNNNATNPKTSQDEQSPQLV